MTLSEIDRMARNAGIKNDCDGIWCNADQLVRFASLVAEAAAATEREECAWVCERNDSFRWSGAAAAIRARATKTRA
jgi:hypothetical protein